MSAAHSTNWNWPAWRGDEAVRRLTPDERGIWIDLLSLAAAGNPTGFVVDAQGRQIPLEEIARFTNCTDLERLSKLINAIVEKGAGSRDRTGRLFNRRMVRDASLSAKRSEAGKIGVSVRRNKSNPVLLKQRLSAELKQDGDPSSLSSSDPSSGLDFEKRWGVGTARARDDGWPRDAFEQFYKLYPNKVGRPKAEEALAKVRRGGTADFTDIMAGLLRYVAKTDDRAWCNPATWLNQHRWADQPATVNGGPNGQHRQGGGNGARAGKARGLSGQAYELALEDADEHGQGSGSG